MRKFFLAAALVIAAAPATAGDRKTVSEEFIKLMSDRQYTAIILTARMSGRVYSPEQVRSGYRRNLLEWCARYTDAGYAIVPIDGA